MSNISLDAQEKFGKPTMILHLFCFFVHLLGSIYKEIETAIIKL